MRRSPLLVGFIFILLAACGTLFFSPAPRFVHREGEQLVAPDGKPLHLRGINLGNWLMPEGYMFGIWNGPQSAREVEGFFEELVGPEQAAAFWRSYRDNYITEDDIRFLHRAGFNSVRVPLHYKLFARGGEGFRLLDHVVEWAGKYGMYVILDLHAAPGGQTGTNIDDSAGYPWLYESAEAQEQTVRLWQRIAWHYRDNPAVLGYDLLNEPLPNFPALEQYNPLLEPLYKRITAAIRQVDRQHVIILGGARWDTNFEVFGPPFDSNVMYTLHGYGAPPVQKTIQPFLDFRARYHVPLYLGESGENKDAWIQAFRELMEQHQIGWAFWPYKKMGATTAVVAWQKPVYWDEIVAYAKVRRGPAAAEKQLAARPSVEHARAALADMLEKIQLAHCHVNAGYMKALGLAPDLADLLDGDRRREEIPLK